MTGKEPEGGGRGWMLLAGVGMVACCALPLLLLSGGLGAAAAWLFEGNVIWLLLASVLAVVAGALFVRHRRGASQQEQFHESNPGQTRDPA